MRRAGKRTAPATVHFEPITKLALEEMRLHEQRTISTVIKRIVESDPTVQLFIQKIGKRIGND